MKRIVYVTICAAFLMMASVALATPITPIDVVTPDGTLLTGQFDFAPGSGLSVNGNFNNPPVGDGGTPPSVQLLYQAFTSALLAPDNTALSTPNINKTYEFTATASLYEFITAVTDPTKAPSVVLFSLDASKNNVINLYYDTNTATFANVANGTGFNDIAAGTSRLILTAVPFDLSGVYSVNTDTNGNGVIDNQDTGTGSVDIKALVTFVDNSILPDVLIGGLQSWTTHFIGTANTPPEGVDTTHMFDGTIPNYFTGAGGTTPFNTQDIMLKVDGNAHFTPTTIPEPGTIMLFGSGLIGLGFVSAVRRRFKK